MKKTEHWQNEPNEKDLANFAKVVFHPFALVFYLLIMAYVSTAQAQGLTKDDMPALKGMFNLGEVVNLDALSYAVGRHETGNCTVTSNFSDVNNCHGIKVGGGVTVFPAFINGQRWETSGDYFKDLWTRKYGGMPDFDKAEKYSNDRPNAWLNNVTQFYHEYNNKLTF